MKLKTKFILPTLVLILLGMSITTWLTYRRSTDALSAMAIEKARTNLSSLLSMVDIWVDGAQNEVITLSKTALVANALTDTADSPKAMEQALALLRDSTSRHPNFDSLLIINTQGTVTGSLSQGLIKADLRAREYVQKALAGQNFISSPLFSTDKGTAVFVIASPVRAGGKIVGVLAAGVTIDQFSKQFVTPLNTAAGYPFILSPDGLVLAHPDTKLVGKFNMVKETDYGGNMAGQTSGTLDIVSQGVRQMILFETSKATGWVLGMAINESVAFASAQDLGLLILTLSVGQALVLAIGIWIILTMNVLKPVGSLVVSAEAIAAGKLDTALDTTRRDEIGHLQRAMAAMVENLKNKIAEAEDKGQLATEETQKAQAAMAEAVAAREKADHAREEGMLQAAERLQDIVAALSSASEEISAQIEQSSRGSEEQSQRVGEAATSMEEMNATVLEVAKNASTAAETADAARKKANHGSDIVDKVIKGIGEVQSQALAMKNGMTALGRQAEGIGAILNVISDIADQTNLLALNAAIEAARAGEAGRGFAVVADEVRKLAEKTMTATKEVGQAITGIQQGTRANIGNVDQVARTIDEATSLAGASGQALDEIVGLVDTTTDQVRSIATAAEEQSSASEEINRSITDISRIATESAQALRGSAQAIVELADQSQILRTLIDEMRGNAGAVQGRPRALSRRSGA
jgi:methyl-accepting chemotaxis protein